MLPDARLAMRGDVRSAIRRNKLANDHVFVYTPHMTALRRFWHEHGIVLLAYLVLSAALTWPLLRDFTTAVTGISDPRHHHWVLWHTKEALLGREPLFHTSLLYYPRGTTLMTHSLGPAAGLMALPFWLLGPEAAYNGTLLVGFWLTGYCMYLLARSLGLKRGVAFFAGMVLLASPRHLTAVYGHLTKTFLGALPLTLLGLHKALTPNRSAWWSVVTALALLLAVLYTGEQYVFGGIALAFFVVARLLTSRGAERWFVLRRSALVVASTAVLTGQLLVAILAAASDPAITVEVTQDAFQYQPDLIQFFVPSHITSRFIGPLFSAFLTPYTKSPVETATFVAWTGQLLCFVALIKGKKPARIWLLFAVCCAVLALGPTLTVLGKDQFTVFKLPIPLPFAFLTSLPGLGFLRSSGRFMIVGSIGFGIAASFGLDWLIDQIPGKLRSLTVLLAVALVLLESWPMPFPQEKLRPVPQFYQQIAQDEELYGVFDLPIRPYQELTWRSHYVNYSSDYMIYQMTHRKGIASGYLSRTYTEHPLFSYLITNAESGPAWPDVLVNGQVSDPYTNFEYELAVHNYRYVVWHKPQGWYPIYKSGSWGESAAKELIDRVFDQREPLMDDKLARVYAVAPSADALNLTTSMKMAHNWYSWRETSPDSGLSWRWAKGPAELLIHCPRSQQARLEITPVHVYEPGSQFGVGAQGIMVITNNGQPPQRLAVEAGQRMGIDLQLAAGRNTVTLALEAGSFRPRELIPGSDDQRVLSFSVSEINLLTE